jgi:hypothetical protein
MNDNIDEIEDNVKKKTFSIHIKNNKNGENNVKVLNFLSKISKNIYNTTIYIYSIYLKYNSIIYRTIIKEIEDGILQSNDSVDNRIYELLQYFYNINTSKDSKIKENNNYLYKKIKEKLKDTFLNNNNYNTIRQEIIDENINLLHNSIYEYDFIIDSILKSIYTSNYNRTVYQIANKIPITIQNNDFIESVKNKQNLFKKEKSFKEYIQDYFLIKLFSDQNIVSRIIYKNLGDNYNKIPADLIVNIIKKAFGNFSSFWKLKLSGKKCNMPKYLDKDELFILPYYCRSFIVKDDYVRLTVGEYIANNYIEIVGNDNLVCLNKMDKTDHKKYVDKKFLNKINIKDKITTKNHFTVNVNGNNMFISKDNKNIINSCYIYFKIPEKIKKQNIKLIEVNPLYKGLHYKMNFTYDITENQPKEKNNSIQKIIKEKSNKTKESAKIKEHQSEECISIDFGMRNLMTIYNPTGYQHIIKGNYLVSMNSYYNNLIDNCKSILENLEENKINKLTKKELEKIIGNFYKIIKDNEIKMIFDEKIKEKGIKENIKEIKEYINRKRYNLEIKRKEKINYYFNKIVKFLWINYNDKKSIICGYNLGWKKGIKLGNKNNRNFSNIPFSKLLNKLKEKFNEKLIITEESYTSKCDALSLEEVGRKDVYKGSREQRGLYSSNKGKYINADLNGAINIMRKKVILKEIKGNNLYNPIVVKIITPQKVKLSYEVVKPVGKGQMGDQKQNI